MARFGVFGLMALAIALSRLIEVEVRPEPSLTVGVEAAQEPSPKPKPAQSADRPAPPANLPQGGGDPPPRRPAVRTYTIRPGDTLGAISKKAYGTTRHWKAILEANRDKIPSEAKMRPGVELRLPNIPR